MTSAPILENAKLSGTGLSRLRDDSPIAACLLPLLAVLGWRGEARHIAEALPHFTDVSDMGRLRAVLGNLNYNTRMKEVRLSELDDRLIPCLFESADGEAFVVLERKDDQFSLFRGLDSTVQTHDGKGLKGTAYFISEEAEKSQKIQKAAIEGRWFEEVSSRFKGLVWQMLAITFVSNLLAIAVPLFIMNVYDRVIGSGSFETLYFLMGGVCIALAADVGLRLLRARILAYIGGRIDMIVGTTTFQQIVSLPVFMTERASVGAQVARLRQFESIREFFTGPLSAVFLDLPFILIFILVIALIAGPLAWVPVALILTFILAAILVLPLIRRHVSAANQSRATREAFLIEAISQLRTIKGCGAESIWSERHRNLSAASAITGFKTSQVSTLAQTIAQFLMMAGGVATLGVGTLLVLDGTATVGALIASMALIWRLLSPLQLAFLSYTKLEQVGQGLKQINQLMRQKPERDPSRQREHLRTIKGAITFDRASLRYMAKSKPALLGINIKIEPGEVIAVAGSNGSGKSTFMKLIACLYEAQAGAVFIDGIDARQFEIEELRSNIAYVPQVCDLFYGTVAQNLRLSNPTASDADLAQAAMESGLMEDILRFPEGFETRLTDQLQQQLPNGTKQKINLARAYVKKAPIYLMDEPANNLDHASDQILMRKVQQLRGSSTVVMVTHRPSHMRLADRVLYFDNGQLMLSGAPEEVMPQLGLS
ncbi:MAG: ATP-binding cassette domain-containing protein [Pseudomonadota bacterium]